MPDLVKAKCPHCQNDLRLPVAWLGQSMRCKFCHKEFKFKPKSPPPAPAPVVKTGTTVPAANGIKPARPPKPPAVKVQPAPARPARPRDEEDRSPFDFDDVADEPAPKRRRRRQRHASSTWWKGALLGICIVGVVVTLGVLFGPTLLAPGPEKTPPPPPEKKIAEAKAPEEPVNPLAKDPEPVETVEPKKTPPKKETPKVEVVPTIKKAPPVVVPRDPFPRRALLVGVSNYLYANPVQYGQLATDRSPGSSTAALLKHFVNILHVPANQAAELSDRGTSPRPPTKPVIETTVSTFLSTCRAQDRIILLFAGNAVEIDKEAYFVPQEADPDDPAKLISFKWLYDRLGACKARQKVLIFDVCRFDAISGQDRAAEPMGAVLRERLAQAPPGVQVWSACSAKQQSIEMNGGSLFLAGLCQALKSRQTIQSPGDSLPLDVLVGRVNAHLDATLRDRKMQQVSLLNGKEAPGGAPYDVSEPAPPAVRVLAGPGEKGDFADRALIRGIFAEINAIPTARSAKGRPPDLFPVDALSPFPAKALQGYEADYPSLDELKRIVTEDPNRYPLRAAVLNAIKEMNDSEKKFSPRMSFAGPVNDQVKKKIHAEQRLPAQMIATLEGALAVLEKAGKLRDKEPSKRWQANFDLAMARLKGRLVVLYEYNNLLAQIRGDGLPPLTDGATGYRVSSRKKVQVPEGVVKNWVKEITSAWTKLIREHPDTPWSVTARREQSAVYGLEWRPFRP